VNALESLAEMFGTEMMDFIKDGETEMIEGAGKKLARADGLNHGNRAIKFGTDITFLTLNATNADSRHQSPKFIGPLICQEFLMNHDEETLPDFKCRRDAGKCFAVAAGKTNDTIVIRTTKRI